MHKKIYASDYAKLDSDVYKGGGTDETALIQSLLDKALEWGRLHLIMDGAALVTGLEVHSNTTIECMNKDCGFYLADNSDCSILVNASRSIDTLSTKNITLFGGTYNHNGPHQQHHVKCDDPVIGWDDPDCGPNTRFVMGLEFYGVENLNIRDVTICNQRTFALTVGNFRHVNIENTYVELPDEIPFGNQDGFHFWGPGQFLTIRNVGGRTGDDFMNIGPDERDKVSSITDVLVDGVMLDDAYQGIRLLSRGTGRLDRVTVRNVTGTYRCYGFYINPWFIDDTMGNFGNIVFENIDLRHLDNVYGHPPFLFSVGGDIESLTFRNIQWYHPYDVRNIFQIGYPFHDFDYEFKRKPRIQNLLIDGLFVTEDKESSAEADHIIVRGIVDRMTVRDVDITRPVQNEPSGCLLRLKPDAEVGRVFLNRIYAENMNSLVNVQEGKIDTVFASDIILDRVEEPVIADGKNVGKISGDIQNV